MQAEDQPRPKKLLEQVRDAIRLKHYSYRTEESYVDWIRRYILFHNKQHPKEMGVEEIEAFLTHLAVEQQVAASTQNQAFSALLFLYREVLKIEFAQPIQALRARESRHLPTVLTPDEVRAVISQLSGTYQLVVQILYGSGLRQREALGLRVKDIDFGQRQLGIQDAKGKESRVTLLPDRLLQPLQTHLQFVKRQHQQDLDRGYGSVYLSYALER
jgi:integrase